MEELEELAYLWDGSEPGWVLVRGKIAGIPMIFNRITCMALIMEDNDEWRAAAERMLAHDVPLLDRMPPKE
jgi:hypothetical protein